MNSFPRKSGYWRSQVTMTEDFDILPQSVLSSFEDSEMLADIQAYDHAILRNEEFFPLDVIEKITTDGENPLKVWREYRNLTQEQLAEAIGTISPTDISAIESGEQTGSVNILKEIALVLNVDLEMITHPNN